jgi:transcription factor IIIB subunit 2
MSVFIGSVLSRLNNPGLSPRAEAIFTQAMAKGNYRWGRKAKRTAGASIAIALREACKSDSLRDIAFFLDDSPVSLARAFQSVVFLLEFSLASTDPAVHLPILHAHLQSVIHPETVSPSPPSQLPKSLVSVLTPLSLQAAVHTATSLSQIVSRHSPPLALTNLPTPPTACALLILGLEAEARAPLPHLGELTRTLATRFALGPGVVSSRYKILYDLIEEWIRHVPWLDQIVYKGKGTSARSKVSKRSIAAKGIKDVIQFHQEIWLSRMQSQHKVNLDLEPDPDDDEDQGDDDSVNTPTVASSSKNSGESVIAPPSGKRCKLDKKGNAMQAAHRLLLDPLSSGSATFSDDISMLAHILTCSRDELSRVRGTPPTRLQLLAVSRGGSTADHIADEELFANGELEGVLRNEQEREALLPLFQLNWSEEISREEAAVARRKSIATAKRGAKRVDMDAMARLLGHGDGASSHEEDAVFPDPDNIDAYQWGWDDYTHRSAEHQEVTEVVSDWRPGSPDDNDDDVFGEFRNSAEDRYEEEI